MSVLQKYWNYDSGELVVGGVALEEALATLLNGYLAHSTSKVQSGPEDLNLWVRHPNNNPDLQESRIYSLHQGDYKAYEPLRRVVRAMEVLANWGQYPDGNEPQLDYLKKQLRCNTFELPPREALTTNLGIILVVIPVLWPEGDWPRQEELGDDPETALALMIEAWLLEKKLPRDTLNELMSPKE